MLGTHPHCLATPESSFVVESYKRCIQERGGFEPVAALDFIRSHWSFKHWDLALKPTAVAALRQSESYRQLIETLVGKFGEKTNRPAPEIWIDHTPDNVLHTTTLGDLFPEAKMIHIVRDGRACAASVMKLEWGPNTAYSAAQWWAERLAHGLAAESNLGPQLVKRVRYEDLVIDPQNTLQEVCAFLQLDYQPEMVQGTGFRSPGINAHQHTLIGRPVQANRITAWENELSARQIEIFESVAGDLLEFLGYELKYGLHARVPTQLEQMSMDVQDLYRANISNRWFKTRYRMKNRVKKRLQLLPSLSAQAR
jgi:hypothetical protein